MEVNSVAVFEKETMFITIFKNYIIYLKIYKLKYLLCLKKKLFV